MFLKNNMKEFREQTICKIQHILWHIDILRKIILGEICLMHVTVFAQFLLILAAPLAILLNPQVTG